MLTYWERGYRAAQIARLIRMNERTAQRYAKQILEEGSLDRKKGSGGHNKITNRVERRVIAHVKDSKKPLHAIHSRVLLGSLRRQ